MVACRVLSQATPFADEGRPKMKTYPLFFFFCNLQVYIPALLKIVVNPEQKYKLVTKAAKGSLNFFFFVPKVIQYYKHKDDVALCWNKDRQGSTGRARILFRVLKDPPTGRVYILGSYFALWRIHQKDQCTHRKKRTTDFLTLDTEKTQNDIFCKTRNAW